MIRSVRISDLGKMEPNKRSRVLDTLVRATQGPPNGEVAQLTERIRRFETDYGMSSQSMRSALSDGSLRETTEICEWLMLLGMRDRIGKLSARAD